MLWGTSDIWESTRDYGAVWDGTTGGKLTASIPWCLWQKQHSQAAAAAARSAAIPRACLHEQCLWLKHECQNVIRLLSATYPGPFGTHSASKNRPNRGKEYSLKIAAPPGLELTPGQVPTMALQGDFSSILLHFPTLK